MHVFTNGGTPSLTALTLLTAITVGGARAGRSWLGGGSSAGSGTPGWASAAANASSASMNGGTHRFWPRTPITRNTVTARSLGQSWCSAAGTAGFARLGWAGNLAGFWMRPFPCCPSLKANWRRPFPGAGSGASFPETECHRSGGFGSPRRGRIQLRNAALPPLCGTEVCSAGRAIRA